MGSEEGVKSVISQIVVGTVATKKNAGVANMIASLERFGWNFTVLCQDERWEGFKTKMKGYMHFCEQQNPDTYVILVDSYDALAVRSPTDFIDTFKSFGADIVCGAERLCGVGPNCVPVPQYWKKASNIHTGVQHFGHWYVNSGFVCGKAQHLIKLYKWAMLNEIKDDQGAVGRYLNEACDVENVKMELDASQKLCLNDGNDWDSLHVSYTKVAAKDNSQEMQILACARTLHSRPWFIHWPGMLVKRTLLEFVRWSKPIELQNYTQVGTMILGSQFIHIGQVSDGVSKTRNLILWIIFGVLLLTVFLLLWFHRRQRCQLQAHIRFLSIFPEDVSSSSKNPTHESNWRAIADEVD